MDHMFINWFTIEKQRKFLTFVLVLSLASRSYFQFASENQK